MICDNCVDYVKYMKVVILNTITISQLRRLHGLIASWLVHHRRHLVEIVSHESPPRRRLVALATVNLTNKM